MVWPFLSMTAAEGLYYGSAAAVGAIAHGLGSKYNRKFPKPVTRPIASNLRGSIGRRRPIRTVPKRKPSDAFSRNLNKDFNLYRPGMHERDPSRPPARNRLDRIYDAAFHESDLKSSKLRRPVRPKVVKRPYRAYSPYLLGASSVYHRSWSGRRKGRARRTRARFPRRARN